MRRAIWTAIVAFFATMAITAVVVIVRENTRPAGAATNATGIVMARIAYNPATLAVRRGSTLVFDNKDVAPHTVTADDGSIDSGLLSPGKAFEVTVAKAFTFHCEVHPSMKGKIELEG